MRESAITVPSKTSCDGEIGIGAAVEGGRAEESSMRRNRHGGRGRRAEGSESETVVDWRAVNRKGEVGNAFVRVWTVVLQIEPF